MFSFPCPYLQSKDVSSARLRPPSLSLSLKCCCLSLRMFDEGETASVTATASGPICKSKETEIFPSIYKPTHSRWWPTVWAGRSPCSVYPAAGFSPFHAWLAFVLLCGIKAPRQRCKLPRWRIRRARNPHLALWICHVSALFHSEWWEIDEALCLGVVF